MAKSKLEFHPASADRWADFVQLFGERGACGGCWCMSWRRTRGDFEKGKQGGNRRAMQRLVAAGREPGVLAYRDGEPIGWCSVAPREEFSFLDRSRVLKPIDEQPVWSISCFFVAKPHRGSGVAVELLKAACDFAGKHGAKIVEGYPVIPTKGPLPAAFAWVGVPEVFKRAGFVEAHRWSHARPIMRIALSKASPTKHRPKAR